MADAATPRFAEHRGHGHHAHPAVLTADLPAPPAPARLPSAPAVGALPIAGAWTASPLPVPWPLLLIALLAHRARRRHANRITRPGPVLP
ncbi:hypothetical protein [Saccharothrix sp. HUAS TT1]|uniref:hypothetical protein n=1 Tax=unclassified Saccharothrix TaxID=2593673 RepID=UPI00345B8F3C